MTHLLTLIVVLPLLGAVLNGFTVHRGATRYTGNSSSPEGYGGGVWGSAGAGLVPVLREHPRLPLPVGLRSMGGSEGARREPQREPLML